MRLRSPALVLLLLASWCGLGLPQPAAAFQTTGTATTWSWQTPLPQGNGLYGISCPTASQCVAVGDAGTIVRTTTSGTHWLTSPSGITTALAAVKCPNFNLCFAVGSGGVVLTSADGGVTWSGQTSTTTNALDGISCASTTVCKAVGAAGTIVGTTSGGTTWTAEASGTAVNLWGISCPSTSQCFAVGDSGTILVFNGTTWGAQSSTTTYPLHTVSCPSTTTCYAAGDNSTILNTTNGGATWAVQPLLATTTRIFSMSCPITTTCVGVADYGIRFTTSNGGTTWNVANTGQTSSQPLNGVSCGMVTTCYAVGSKSHIIASTDSGNTWMRQGGGLITGYHSISCWNTPNCVAVGNAGLIVATSDQGNSWATQTSGTTLNLLGVACPSPTTCYADGQNGTILKTVTSGASWSKVQPSGQLNDFNGISCPNSTTCYAIASHPPSAGSIVITNDGGTTWREYDLGGSDDLGIACPSAGACLIVGGFGTDGYGTVMISNNSGYTWTNWSTHSPHSFNGVSCIDVNHCVIVGDGGAISTTANNGVTWTTQTSGTTNTLRAVHCPPFRTSCVAVGDAGTILHSTDSGVTWTVDASGTLARLESVICIISASGCWAAGANGILWNQGPVSSSASTMTASPSSVPNDGTSASTITVTLMGGDPVPGKTVVVTQYAGPGTANISPASAVTDANGQATFSVTSTTLGTDGFAAQDTTDGVAITLPVTVNFGAPYSVMSTLQYHLTGNDGATWVDIDPTKLVLSFQPTVNSEVILTGNVDLWTSTAGYNQDVGISLSGGGAYPTVPGQPETWKESGGFAGTFSPNAAFVQGVFPLSAGGIYTAKLVWKVNKNANAVTIFGGAGPIGTAYSPTRLTALVVPVSPGVADASSTQQYTLAGSDGSTWKDIDATKLSLNYTPTANGTLLLNGNADLWTANAGVNQDLAISVNGTVAAWKESGGFAGTFSPNAAFVQAAYAVTSGTPYTIKLQWKSNRNAPSSTIVAGAGPIGTKYSPTRLTMQFLPTGPALTDAFVTGQETLANNDGTTWVDMDPNLSFTVTPAKSCLALLSGNADLWTANAGFNQDIAITVNGTVVAWKESGGFAGTFSPNAAFVQTVFLMTAGTPYIVKLQWKTNKYAGGATIFAGAGPIGTQYSPTRVTGQLSSCY